MPIQSTKKSPPLWADFSLLIWDVPILFVAEWFIIAAHMDHSSIPRRIAWMALASALSTT